LQTSASRLRPESLQRAWVLLVPRRAVGFPLVFLPATQPNRRTATGGQAPNLFRCRCDSGRAPRRVRYGPSWDAIGGDNHSADSCPDVQPGHSAPGTSRKTLPMINMVSIGFTMRGHWVAVTEDGASKIHGPLTSHAEATTIAADECKRLGLPPAYVGVR